MSLDDFFKLRKEVVAKTGAPGDDEDADAGLIINPPGEEVPPGMETEGGKVSVCTYIEKTKIKKCFR